jgi:hypothetical protein
MALLRECLSPDELADPARLAAAIKALPLRSPPAAGRSHQQRRRRALRGAGRRPDGAPPARPVLAGEMLDWEAPTGGYLLTACFASGRRAGEGAGVAGRSRPLNSSPHIMPRRRRRAG